LVLGDGKAENVSLVGDRLNNPVDIANALKDFKLASPIAESYELLLTQLNKTEAKGQTALGPALTAAIEVASRGSKGSVVVLCTDGLANIGVGAL
jgi:Mg-chelatase subunit ChlD